MAKNEISDIDVASGFNTFTVELRSRIESLTKQVLVVSGGIQTITISAFLSSDRPILNEFTIELLKCAWLQLSASMILCLLFMLSQIFGLIHLGFQHKKAVQKSSQGIQFITTWLPLRIFNWIVSLSGFALCISGVYTISRAAVSLIGA